MQKVKEISNSQYEIQIKLSKDEVKPYLERAMDVAISKVNEPGFRAGKMPKKMFLSKYGVESTYPEAVDIIVNEIYPKVIEVNDLQVVDYPNFDWASVKISEEGFEIQGTVDVMPNFELPDHEKIQDGIKKPEVKVTKKEVDEEISNLLAKDAKFEAKEDYAAKSGDITVIDFEGFVDDVAFEGGKGESYALTLGSGSFIPGFEDQLIGSKAGDKVDVTVTFPENYQAEDLAGKEAVFKCTVNEVQKRTIPKLTDKVIQSLGDYDAKNKSELEGMIKERISESRKMQAQVEYEQQILAKLVEECKLEVPQSMINQEVEASLQGLEENFKAQGFGLDMYLQMTGSTIDQLKQQLAVDAKSKIELHLLVDKFEKHNDIKVSKKEIKDRMTQLSDQYNMSEEEITKQLGGTTEPLERDLKFEKAREILLNGKK